MRPFHNKIQILKYFTLFENNIYCQQNAKNYVVDFFIFDGRDMYGCFLSE